MENLSDVEFGSDKSNEEAPILVAQRYLNIFRQVHIFKKEKRDQFDDELLALPSNITDFFKRMPGGRLLVEHIEEVKTERGIDFVKTSREEFTNGSDSVSNPTVTPSSTANGQVTGGNVVIDSSFAETLSKSLAEAFKQNPINNTGGISLTSDLGPSFELIAEEIRSSHSSLLNVLRETRNITDTVISSQITISKMLENLLESNKYTDNASNDLSNRILASQAAITKLLENLCHAYNQNSTNGMSPYQLEERLSLFKQQMLSEMQSLAHMPSSSVHHHIDDEEETMQPSSFVSSDISDFSTDISGESSFNEADTYSFVPDEDTFSQPLDEAVTKEKKKKKKKKKKVGEQLLASAPFVSSFSENPEISSGTVDVDFADKVTTDNHPIDALIKNGDYKYDDDFSHIDLSEPPLDIDSDVLSTNEQQKEEQSVNKFDYSAFTKEHFSDVDDHGDGLDFSLPEQAPTSSNDEPEQFMPDEGATLDTFTGSDDLDFSLPEQAHLSSNKKTEQPIEDEDNALDAFIDNDDLDFSLPEQASVSSNDETEQPIEDEDNALDAFIDNDDLNFSLPEQSHISSNNETEQFMPDEDNTLDTFIGNDDLDFSLPEQAPASSNDETEQFITNEDNALDAFISTGDKDISLTEEATLSGENDHYLSDVSTDTSDGLDNLIADNNSDFPLLDESSNNYVAETNPYSVSNVSSDVDVDGYIAEDDVDHSLSNNTEFSSEPAYDNPQGSTVENVHDRYSAELDKIRQALTSDNIDIASLETPITLDDYAGDDENLDSGASADVGREQSDYTENSAIATSTENTSSGEVSEAASSDNSQEDEWDWEYVDENGNIVSSQDGDEDWEWAYVEDDTPETNQQEDENKN